MEKFKDLPHLQKEKLIALANNQGISIKKCFESMQKKALIRSFTGPEKSQHS